jgi:hypothetical protein
MQRRRLTSPTTMPFRFCHELYRFSLWVHLQFKDQGFKDGNAYIQVSTKYEMSTIENPDMWFFKIDILQSRMTSTILDTRRKAARLLPTFYISPLLSTIKLLLLWKKCLV